MPKQAADGIELGLIGDRQLQLDCRQSDARKHQHLHQRIVAASKGGRVAHEHERR